MDKDFVLTDYFNRVGKRLATSQQAQSSGFSFTFEVVADPTINAGNREKAAVTKIHELKPKPQQQQQPAQQLQ